jgi:hypothetical protein
LIKVVVILLDYHVLATWFVVSSFIWLGVLSLLGWMGGALSYVRLEDGHWGGSSYCRINYHHLVMRGVLSCPVYIPQSARALEILFFF